MATSKKKPAAKTAPATPAVATASPTATPIVAAEKPASPAAAPVAKPTKPAKPGVKTAAKPVSKPANKTTVKPAAKAAAKKTVPPEAVKPAKEKKPKLVRDSFTIPKNEYVVLEALKQRAAKMDKPVKKSELLRAGIKALAAMTDAALATALGNVPAIKTGRPSQN